MFFVVEGFSCTFCFAFLVPFNCVIKPWAAMFSLLIGGIWKIKGPWKKKTFNTGILRLTTIQSKANWWPFIRYCVQWNSYNLLGKAVGYHCSLFGHVNRSMGRRTSMYDYKEAPKLLGLQSRISPLRSCGACPGNAYFHIKSFENRRENQNFIGRK